ncbi:cytochrome c-type biogenesis protein CcmF [Litoreibacter ascidiaceicola]|uniref:Cytochrome c-type biogenesis protein CcmF n=1 Tax=Litoreibacter ascidiaceicola TaxID=1486859 RepID=A0A1M4V5X4_9RHOB|nr:heme lyase CcmF/NrfE family subunit [Litoreibacter ascidiaceicola]SHE64386.1 cytochrome c-type biogenesis protein CcmF [Litoreibacter ascidiaceicola]
MIPELGQFALSLALIAAVVQSVLPMMGAARGNALWMRSAQASALAQFALIAFAFAALMRSYIVSDFTVVNVVNNSHSLKPMIYKVAGTWGNHEGSLLLWVFILAGFGAAVAFFGRNIPEALKARTLSVQAWISVGFISFMLFTSNPFTRVFPPPLDGNDLNPLLQDIGLAIHPPLLYVGYVGFSIVFSFAVAALIEGRVDPAWARWVRPWTLAAWTALSAGIGLGSWWAYYELGWGGWWFWDPVENVSFMPWLLGTALLHSAIVTEKRDTFKSWTILLAILTFSLSLLGTFIVRSGLLTSVHAFAVDPERGIYILGLLFVSIGGSLALFAWRAPSMEGGGLFAPISREAGLLINNLLLATATATVLFGTLYPLFLEAVTGDKISVGPPFFNAGFIPIMLPLLLVMGIGPFLSWKRADIGGVLSRLKLAFAIAVIAALVVWYITTGGPVLAIIAMGVSVWLLVATAQEWIKRVKLFQPGAVARIHRQPRASHGMTLAHLGVAILAMGATGSSAWKEDIVTFASPGTQVEIAGFELTFESIERQQGPNYIAQVATLNVTRDGDFVTKLYPERRDYPAAGSTTTESSIRQTLAGDLYTSIAEPAAEGAKGQWTLRVLYEPLVNFLWIGTAFLVLGGGLSLSDRRLRVGAPRKSKAAPVGATPAE